MNSLDKKYILCNIAMYLKYKLCFRVHITLYLKHEIKVGQKN